MGNIADVIDELLRDRRTEEQKRIDKRNERNWTILFISIILGCFGTSFKIFGISKVLFGLGCIFGGIISVFLLILLIWMLKVYE